MCGFVLIAGAGAEPGLFRTMLATLAPRGEVEEIRATNQLMAGVWRLRIVDRAHTEQPWVSADGRWLLCYNGEVYNHPQLRAELRARGHRLRTTGDTEVVLAAFLEWGTEAVERLRGEYAFAVVDRSTMRVYLARDPLGVKPLYWARRAGRLHLASEIKALVPVGEPITEVPPGHHGWADDGGWPHLTSHLDLDHLGLDQPVPTDPDEAVRLVRTALADSVRVRVATDLPVGVLLSGGLDSALVLLHARQTHPDCVAFTVGAPDSPDLAHARQLTADFDVPHEVVELRPRDIRLADVREAVRLGELTEYGDIINAVVSAPLFRRVRECGIRVVLTGDGSDELFGGHPMYREVSPDRARALFLHRLRNLGRTELQRVDRVSMGYGVEARLPFLDLALVELAIRLPLEFKLRDGVEKWILREAFADLLPDHVRHRPKNGLSHSSGLHDRARLYKPWFPRLHRSYGYDLAEAVRRDFDTVLTGCGNDLDQAIADGVARQDYTLRERVRDAAGAVRHNLPGAHRRSARDRELVRR